MKASEVLAKAADLIEPEGAWTQGAFGKDEWGQTEEDVGGDDFSPSCFCLFGAVNVASGRCYDEERWPHQPDVVEAFVRRAIGLSLDAPLCRVADWNDDPNRTQAEVVKALRDASELAKAEGR